MRTVEDQLQAILRACEPLDPLELPLLEATGCILAEVVLAQLAVPTFPTVTYPGYAVRCSELAGASPVRPVRLAVADHVGAGFRPEAPLGLGQAMVVAPGSMLPDGADAVVPTRITDGGAHVVSIAGAVARGSGVRPAGEFARTGQVVVSAGTRLGAAQQAALVAAGRSRVSVHPAPRVVVVTVGSELLEAGTPLQPGLVHDANAIALSVAVRQAGGVAYRAGPVPDDAVALASVIEGQCVRADLIVLAGGMGGVVPAAMALVGGLDPTPVAVTPGPVVAFGAVDGKLPVLALPGEPVAAMINYEVFVRPAIRRLMGHRDLFREVIRARLVEPVGARPGVRRFVPVAVSGGAGSWSVEPVPAEQEMSPFAAVSVNGLAVIPEEVESLASGDDVLVIRLDGS